MPFARLFGFGRNPAAEAAHDLYNAVVAQSRQPAFYTRLGVPDTLDGRFDMIVLHAFLILYRLKRESGKPVQTLSQALFDLMFADMDHNLREMGVGDLSVGKKVKQMAGAFMGRIAVYEEGLAAQSDVLERALTRNLYRRDPDDPTLAPECPALMAEYVRRESRSLVDQPLDRLMAGQVTFGPPPEGKDSAP